MLDAMRTYWMTRVVGYDLRTQIGAVRSLSAMWRKLSFPKLSFGKSAPDGVGQRSKFSPTAPIVLGIVASALLLGVTIWALLRLRRRKVARVLSPSAAAAQKLYRQLERALEKRGHARPRHVTAEEHAQQLAEDGFVAAAAVRELTHDYVQARYGNAELSQERVKHLRKLLAQVKRAA